MQKTPFFKGALLRTQTKVLWRHLGNWLLLVLFIGIASGSASALFLISLDGITEVRGNHPWLIYLLPLGGLLIGWGYQSYGKQVEQDTAMLLSAYHQPLAQTIPFRMAPMVLIGTLITHLFGGSAGREGTAVQMGGAIADQSARWFKRAPLGRRTVLLCGIAAGFAAVFGTPWAGAVFAIEVMRHKHWPRTAVLPIITVAWVAHYTCLIWGAKHSSYALGVLPSLAFTSLGYSLVAGLCFGAAAWLFIQLGHWQSTTFKRWIPNNLWRPMLGGSMLAAVYLLTQNDRYLGLGLPVIAAAFEGAVLPFDFLLKIIFTTFTLAVGFKGGEVTPLFFIGATLGVALGGFLPLPLPLLAGMGLVAVFAGATNSPIACVIMGMELFGITAAPYLIVACGMAYLFSGKMGIYSVTPSAHSPAT